MFLLMLQNVFLKKLSHNKTLIRNFRYCRIYRNPLIFLQGVMAISSLNESINAEYEMRG